MGQRPLETWALSQGVSFSPEESPALKNVPPFVSSIQQIFTERLLSARKARDANMSRTQPFPPTEFVIQEERIY